MNGLPAVAKPGSLGLTDEAIYVAAGRKHTCAIFRTSDGRGEVFCWGNNSHGQLGMGDTSNYGINGTTGAMDQLVPVGF